MSVFYVQNLSPFFSNEELPYPPYSALVGSLSLAALSLAFSAPAEAVIVFNFAWTGDPAENSNITSSQDATLRATGTVTINKNAGESFVLSDITTTNITVTGTTITPFTFTSWSSAGGTIAGDGLSASFSASGNPTFTQSSPYLFFGCFSPNCNPSSIGVIENQSGPFNLRLVSYDSQANALASMTMTAQPVPIESDALPVVGATLFMAGGLWWKKKRAQAKAAEFVEKT